MLEFNVIGAQAQVVYKEAEEWLVRHKEAEKNAESLYNISEMTGKLIDQFLDVDDSIDSCATKERWSKERYEEFAKSREEALRVVLVCLGKLVDLSRGFHADAHDNFKGYRERLHTLYFDESYIDRQDVQESIQQSLKEIKQGRIEKVD